MDLTVVPLKSRNGRPLRQTDSFILSYSIALTSEDLTGNQLIDSSDWYSRPVVAGRKGEALLPGLAAALEGRSFGDTIRVVVPPHLAFGERGVPGRVPPNAVLYLQVEIAALENDVD